MQGWAVIQCAVTLPGILLLLILLPVPYFKKKSHHVIIGHVITGLGLFTGRTKLKVLILAFDLDKQNLAFSGIMKVFY